MNFTAKNEQNEVGYQLIANGTKTITRRIIRRNCKKCKEDMLIMPYSPNLEKKGEFMLVAHCFRHGIHRKIIGINDIISVCPGRAKKAVCECGHLYQLHQYSVGIGGDEEPSYTLGKCKECGCKCQNYLPLKVKIVSLMRHGDWQTMVKKRVAEKMLTGNGYDAQEEFKEEEMFEAVLEGFTTRQGWLSVYPKMKVEIGDTWRIEFLRIGDCYERKEKTNQKNREEGQNLGRPSS